VRLFQRCLLIQLLRHRRHLGIRVYLFHHHTMGAESVGILDFGLSFVGMFTLLSNLDFDSAHSSLSLISRIQKGFPAKI